MNILLISPYVPYPPITGGKVRVLNFLKNLQKRHKVTLVCLMKKREEEKDAFKVRKWCHRVIPVLRRPAWSLPNLLRAAFSHYSFLTIVNNFSKETERAIVRAIQEEHPDVIHLETFYMAQSFLSVKEHMNVPKLLAKVDVEAQVYFRNAKVSRNPFVKFLGFYDAKKMLSYEIEVCRYFDRISAASRDDRALLAQELQHRGIEKHINIIPNGVDTTHFSRTESIPKAKIPTILFVGNFRYFANTDAVFFFVHEIFPAIQKRIPNVRMIIVGPRLAEGVQRKMSGDVGKLARDVITVTGRVSEEEKLKFLSSSWVCVAPIRIGSGTKLKILEAMSMELPVVTTSVGIEGIEATKEKEVVVKDEPLSFATAVGDLLEDEKKRTQMGRNARALMKQKYDWRMISGKLEKLYERMKEQQG